MSIRTLLEIGLGGLAILVLIAFAVDEITEMVTVLEQEPIHFFQPWFAPERPMHTQRFDPEKVIVKWH